jgi:hypothetical protein
MVDAACDDRLHGRHQAKPVGESRPSLEDHHTDDKKSLWLLLVVRYGS